MRKAAAPVATLAVVIAGASACGSSANPTVTDSHSPAARAPTSAARRGAAPPTPFGPYRFVRRPVVSFSLAIRAGNVPTYTAYIRLNRALPRLPNGDSSGRLEVDGAGGPSNPLLADHVRHCYVQDIDGPGDAATLRHPRTGAKVTITLGVARQPAGLLRATVPIRNVQQTGFTDPDTINLRSLGCSHLR